LVFSSRALVRALGIDQGWILWAASSALICAAIGVFVAIGKVMEQ
jgi:hypothetical protein